MYPNGVLLAVILWSKTGLKREIAVYLFTLAFICAPPKWSQHYFCAMVTEQFRRCSGRKLSLRLQDKSLPSVLGPVVNDIADATLADMQGLWQRVVEGTVSVC
jgi:hypothetical protein